MSMPTTNDILISFYEMFGRKGRLVRQDALKMIMNTKMSKRTLIGDHMICMIRLFNKMEILRVEIDGKT